jgi:hypothetical protein
MISGVSNGCGGPQSSIAKTLSFEVDLIETQCGGLQSPISETLKFSVDLI